MMKNNQTTIKVAHLYKNYDTISASNNICFETHTGDIIALLGPNGAGESTLMNMIAGYLAPSSGSSEVLGKSILDYSLNAKENIGFLPEDSPLYPDLTVKMFLKYMAELRGISKAQLNEVIDMANIHEV